MCEGISGSSRRISLTLVGFLAVLAVASIASQTAVADSSFKLEVSPYARILDALDDKNDGLITSTKYYDIVYEESCDNPHLRIRARNKPALMLLNDSTTLGAEITSFAITIQSGPYFFSSGDLASDNFSGFVRDNTIYNDPGVSVAGSSIADGGKTLIVNFNGLTVGKRVIFNIDLDASSGFAYPDYRTVLFGAPYAAGDDPTDPATYIASFTNPTATVEGDFISSKNPTQFDSAPTYSNENIRGYHDPDKVEHVPIGGQIPEPSSVAIGLAGIAGLLALRRRFAVN